MNLTCFFLTYFFGGECITAANAVRAAREAAAEGRLQVRSQTDPDATSLSADT